MPARRLADRVQQNRRHRQQTLCSDRVETDDIGNSRCDHAGCHGATNRSLRFASGSESVGKKGYSWLTRFEEGGLEALVDRSRRPRSNSRAVPAAVVELIVELRKRRPRCGPRKLVAVLELDYPLLPFADHLGGRLLARLLRSRHARSAVTHVFACTLLAVVFRRASHGPAQRPTLRSQGSKATVRSRNSRGSTRSVAIPPSRRRSAMSSVSLNPLDNAMSPRGGDHFTSAPRSVPSSVGPMRRRARAPGEGN